MVATYCLPKRAHMVRFFCCWRPVRESGASRRGSWRKPMVSEDRTAIITGAAGGLGAAVAKLLASSAHRVVLVDVRREEVERTAREIPYAKSPPQAIAAD